MGGRLAVLALIGFSSLARAGDILVDAREVFYDVNGATESEVLADLRRQAHTVGKDYFGDARWHVQWNYDYERPTHNSCRIGRVHVTLVQRTVLPRWNGDGATLHSRARWERFISALREHEAGHQRHGTLAAEEIQQALRPLRARACGDLGQKANATGEAIVERYAAQDVQYDTDTDHGARQGARWPPE